MKHNCGTGLLLDVSKLIKTLAVVDFSKGNFNTVTYFFRLTGERPVFFCNKCEKEVRLEEVLVACKDCGKEFLLNELLELPFGGVSCPTCVKKYNYDGATPIILNKIGLK